MDLNGDDYVDLATINDGSVDTEHLFLNDRRGGFENATAKLWPESENLGYDDNVAAFLDYDSDRDADLLKGSLNGLERLLENDGSGNYEYILGFTAGTLGIAVANLDGDCRSDVVQAQGEDAWPRRPIWATE